MLEYVTMRLQQLSSEPIGLVFALILGMVSAIGSVCCMLPALGLLVGYAGMGTMNSRSAVLKATIFFTLGTILSLMIIGGIAGFIGQVAQAAMGRYWKVFAGIVAIFLGLATLKLLPFQLSFGKVEKFRNRCGTLSSAFAGLVLGGIIAVGSLCCNPGIFIVVGAAILQGAILGAILLLTMFAIGFAIPLGTVMLGVSLSTVSLAAKGADAIIRWIAGLVLLVVGFYFLITF